MQAHQALVCRSTAAKALLCGMESHLREEPDLLVQPATAPGRGVWWQSW